MSPGMQRLLHLGKRPRTAMEESFSKIPGDISAAHRKHIDPQTSIERVGDRHGLRFRLRLAFSSTSHSLDAGGFRHIHNSTSPERSLKRTCS